LELINNLLERNKDWASNIKESEPEFYEQLSKEQRPNILWIGCSDSRVPPTELAKLSPGDLFVHRNIANVVLHTDLNLLSVLQFAVQTLEVDNIIICGHYGCGGVKAAMEDKNHGLIDNWLQDIKDISRYQNDQLEDLPEDERYSRLCEINVLEQVNSICNTTIVRKAWKQGQKLIVHGLIYDLETGLLNDLDTAIDGPETLH